jgi:hypothetical protein
MTLEERQLMNELFKRIADEQDAFIFHQLVEILTGCLHAKRTALLSFVVQRQGKAIELDDNF